MEVHQLVAWAALSRAGLEGAWHAVDDVDVVVAVHVDDDRQPLTWVVLGVVVGDPSDLVAGDAVPRGGQDGGPGVEGRWQLAWASPDADGAATNVAVGGRAFACWVAETHCAPTFGMP